MAQSDGCPACPYIPTSNDAYLQRLQKMTPPPVKCDKIADYAVGTAGNVGTASAEEIKQHALCVYVVVGTGGNVGTCDRYDDLHD
jgi:hypothetical protein